MTAQWGNLEKILIFYISLENKKGRKLIKTQKYLGSSAFPSTGLSLKSARVWHLYILPEESGGWSRILFVPFAAHWTNMSSSVLPSTLFQGALQMVMILNS